MDMGLLIIKLRERYKLQEPYSLVSSESLQARAPEQILGDGVKMRFTISSYFFDQEKFRAFGCSSAEFEKK